VGKDLVADILKVLVLGAGLASYFVKDKKIRQLAIITLLAACTALVGYTFYIPLSKPDHDSKSLAVMDSAHAESMMRLASAIDTIGRELGAMTGSVAPDDKVKDMGGEMHAAAFKSAKGAVEHDPESVAMRFRELIMAGEDRRPIKAELFALKQCKDASAQPAASLIEQLYEKHSIAKSEIPAAQTLIDKLTSRGWFRDVATIELYRRDGEDKKATKMLDDYHDALVGFAGRAITLMIAAVCLGLLGTLFLFAQFFFWPRKLTSEADRALIAAPADYGFLKVYGVFIGWLTLECCCSPLFGEIAKYVKRPSGRLDPLTIAVVVFVIYVLNNVPALVIAWIVAIKATGVKFAEAVKLRFKVGKTGLFGLIFAGVSAWLCCIPLILLTAAISKNYSQGSSSPILPIISEVVRSGGIFTIVLFVLVLGVVPALCEETLFRGFLYTSLRIKHNVFVSVLVSAAVFAAVHMDFGAFGQLFVLGAVFALVMERTKSLIPSMIAHCLWNSGMLVVMMAAFGG